MLIDIENQANILSAYSVILCKREESLPIPESLRRHAVDLHTLAKGINNRNTCRVREELAKFLEEHGETDEARLWYDLAPFA